MTRQEIIEQLSEQAGECEWGPASWWTNLRLGVKRMQKQLPVLCEDPSLDWDYVCGLILTTKEALVEMAREYGYDFITACEIAEDTIREFLQSGKQRETYVIGGATVTLGRKER